MQNRLTRLTDAYIDRVIEKDLFEERKGALLMERKVVEEQLATPVEPVPARLQKFLELAGDAYLLYKTALPEEKRDFLKIVTSNRQASGKNVEITLAAPFDGGSRKEYASKSGLMSKSHMDFLARGSPQC